MPRTFFTLGPALSITWGVAGVAAHNDPRCHNLFFAPGPLPSYAADTAGTQMHRPVPVLRVSHVEEEGEDDWTHGACMGGTWTCI